MTAATREACLEACSNYSSHTLPAHGWPGCCEFIALRDADKRKCAFYAGRKTDTSPVKAMFAAECTLADDDRNDDTGTDVSVWKTSLAQTYGMGLCYFLANAIVPKVWGISSSTAPPSARETPP